MSPYLPVGVSYTRRNPLHPGRKATIFCLAKSMLDDHCPCGRHCGAQCWKFAQDKGVLLASIMMR